MNKNIQIQGMSCNHCVKRVTNALNQIDGVNAVVSLEKKTATVTLNKPIDDKVLVEAIEDAGYKVQSIK